MHEFVAVVPVNENVETLIIFVLLLLIVLKQPLLAKDFIVMVEFPLDVNPAAVNVPDPAELTVIVAVNPIAAGELRS